MAEGPRLGMAQLPEIAALGGNIEVPAYARVVERRICHIGVGGFHRAHQAWYLHRLLQRGLGEGWGICGIGLRAADAAMHHRLQRQDCLYTLTEADQAGARLTVIGSIMEHLDASRDSVAALERLADPATRIVSLTITEAGYCLKADGTLDLQHADIAPDLADPQHPHSAQGLIVAALARRRAAGLGAFTLMSCDNLIGNGHQLRSAVLGFARAVDAGLAEWIAREASFPLSMVDRITPALDQRRKEAVCAQWGLNDEAPVLCEPWSQWVLEDRFVAGRPRFEEVGVTLSGEVAEYEDLKVSILNGGHSALCHLGLIGGHSQVHEALGEPRIRAWLEAYMREVAQTLPPVPGIDLVEYQAATVQRFLNPAIRDRLLRLAQDTSMKFRQALLPRLALRLDRAEPVVCMSAAIALWIAYLAALDADDMDRRGYQDVDRARLITLGAAAHRSRDAAAFLDAALQPAAQHAPALRAAVNAHLQGIRAQGALHYIGGLVAGLQA